MANSEKSFRDRQAKAQLLQDTVENFTPVFAPADTSLNATNFQLTINGVDAGNSNVETLASNYTTAATQRLVLVKTVKERVTQALSYIKSNKAWDAQCKTAKMAADKLRNISPPKETAPPPGDGGATPPAEENKRSTGQQAYAELAAHFESFINAAMSCAGYAPPSVAITASELGGLLSQFKGLNSFTSGLSGQIKTARELRYRLYFSSEALADKFQSAKDAVKGQYGQSSAQFAAVKSLKW